MTSLLNLHEKYGWKEQLLAFLMAVLITACTQPTTPPPTETPLPPTATDTAAPAITPTPHYPPATQTPTPKPSPTPNPTMLTICMGAEPETLYIYGGSMRAMSNILEAIYDGPIDNNSFGYQPVILEKLPSLADGDAVIQPVTVREGDTVVDADGEVVTLTGGVRVRPASCRAPGCVTRFDNAPLEMDQMIVAFTLIKGLKWSDGTPLTARDSVFSFEIASRTCDYPWNNFTGPCGGIGAGRIETIERTAAYYAAGEHTLYWAGLPGYLDPAYMTNFAHPLPEHRLKGIEPDQLNDAEASARRPMGWGPYIITEWVNGSHIRLARNRHYFRAGEGLPKFDNLIFRFVGQRDTNIARLISGECDVLDLEAAYHLDYGELLELDKEGSLQTHFTTGKVWEHADFGIRPASYDDGYQMGTDRPDIFGDVRTRRAIAKCMDRQAVVDAVYFGQSEVMHTYLPAGHPLFNPDAQRYSFDPNAGAALLEEVGWIDTDNDPETPRVSQGVPNVPNGTPLSFNYWTTTASTRQQASQILADSLALCGVQVELEYWEPAEYFADGPEGPLFGRQFDMGQFAWMTGVEPPCSLWLSEAIPASNKWDGWNETGYSNPEFDQVCHSAQSTLPGQEGYAEAHLQAQEIFAADLPVVPLYLRIVATAARADFCGHKMDSTAKSDFWNIEEYDYGEGCKVGL